MQHEPCLNKGEMAHTQVKWYLISLPGKGSLLLQGLCSWENSTPLTEEGQVKLLSLCIAGFCWVLETGTSSWDHGKSGELPHCMGRLGGDYSCCCNTGGTPIAWTRSWGRQEGWVPAGARHGVPVSHNGKSLLLGAAPAPGSAATVKAGGNNSWATPRPMVLAGPWHQQRLCSAAEAVLSPGASTATLSDGMGMPKIQTAEMTCSCIQKWTLQSQRRPLPISS